MAEIASAKQLYQPPRKQINFPEIVEKVRGKTELNEDDFKIIKTVNCAHIPYKLCSEVMKKFKIWGFGELVDKQV